MVNYKEDLDFSLATQTGNKMNDTSEVTCVLAVNMIFVGNSHNK